MWLAEGHRKLKLARCDAPMKFGAVTLNRTLTRNLLPSNERNVTQVLGETLMQTSDCGRNYQIVKVLATDCTWLVRIYSQKILCGRPSGRAEGKAAWSPSPCARAVQGTSCCRRTGRCVCKIHSCVKVAWFRESAFKFTPSHALAENATNQDTVDCSQSCQVMFIKVWIGQNSWAVFFNHFCCGETFRKCLRCSLNPMQWSKCRYCYNRIERWLRISSQAISVGFGGSPVEKPCSREWQLLNRNNDRCKWSRRPHAQVLFKKSLWTLTKAAELSDCKPEHSGESGFLKVFLRPLSFVIRQKANFKLQISALNVLVGFWVQNYKKLGAQCHNK